MLWCEGIQAKLMAKAIHESGKEEVDSLISEYSLLDELLAL